MLRHSTAHLLAEAVRRLYPGVKIAIGPPIENGFYYDFEFPEPIGEEALERIEDEIQRELDGGPRRGSARRSRPTRRSSCFAERGRAVQGRARRHRRGATISLYTQGDFTDLCRGPHLQDSKPIKAFKLTGLAGAYWRGDEHNKQLTRIYGTAFYSQADLDAYLERPRGGARARPPPARARSSTSSTSQSTRPESPFWHPKGMVIWNALEDLRRRENAQARLRRGEDAADVRRRDLEDLGPLGEVHRTSMFLVPYGEDRTLGAEADELPGAHAPLRQRAAQLPRACRCATPRRRRCTATSAAARCTACCASST